jgi:hypothetical protein
MINFDMRRRPGGWTGDGEPVGRTPSATNSWRPAADDHEFVALGAE